MIEVLVFVDEDCQSCDRVVELLRQIVEGESTLNMRVVSRTDQPVLAARYNVQIIPAVFVNDQLSFYGEFSAEEFHEVVKRSN